MKPWEMLRRFGPPASGGGGIPKVRATEQIGVGMTFGTAILREALITQEQPAEEIQTTFTFGEAQLYVP